MITTAITRLNRTLAVLMLVLVALGAGPLVGRAAADVEDDVVQFDGQEVNFGLVIDADADPLSPGILAWELDASDLWDPRLLGFLAVEGMNPNTTCARIRVKYYDDSVYLGDQISDELCPSTWGTHLAWIDLDAGPEADTRIDKVVIAFQSGSGNTWFGYTKTRLRN